MPFNSLACLVVKAFASRVADPVFSSRLCRGDSSGSSHTCNLNIGSPVATLPGTWHHSVSAETGWPGVRILCLGAVDSLFNFCNFDLSVAAYTADPSLRYASMLSVYLSICPTILWTVGAPYDVKTNLRHSSFSSAFLTVSLSSKPVHSQMLSSHRFLCLPLLLPPCTVPWRNVLARPEDLVMCPYHCSLRCFTMVKSSL